MSSRKEDSSSPQISKISKVKNPLKVGINSSKVEALKGESLLEVEEQSEFSLWRSARQSKPQEEAAALTSESALVLLKKPSKVKKILGILASFVVLVLLFVGIVFYSPLLETRQIDVEGSRLLSQSDIEAKLRSFEGKPLTMITQQKVADAIGYQNVLRSVTIEARAPHRLVVTLHERVPVAVVQDQNQYVLVDNEGVQLTRVQNQEDAHLPLISGGLPVLNTGSYKTMTTVLADLPSSLLQRVKLVDAQSPSSIHLMLTNGVQVNWGTADESELKAKVLTSLMSAMGADSQVKIYDVSAPLAPTTK